MSLTSLIKISDNYLQQCQQLVKLAKVKKLPSGKYRVLSQTGRNLGTYSSKKAAEKRLKQVEYFKYLDTLQVKDDKQEIDLSKLEEISLSSLMRELNKKATKEQVKKFLEIYKLHFDECIKNKIKDPAQTALQHSLIKFETLYKLKFNKKLVKNASITELGSPVTVGNYLANIVKFILTKISPAKRQNSINKVKQKIYNLNENELATKKMPASSSLGQSITFVKTVLFNQNPKYIREVLNSTVKFL
jgi:hypothetical protein